jgi:hypothetical protein
MAMTVFVAVVRLAPVAVPMPSGVAARLRLERSFGDIDR